ncbi:F-box domain-containing protein [Orpheovirus IHUMI-LCC2]|uniref:F-box domain-containing protein n=1 Tax=Orpheovirus IHUMI-LCC2 TaxID=2023057 RepID=A0A2I2L4R8_9VIRU|nr:F-box domain-containing protein [Orpheovirus IHUMI-LCC2]SNW62524.1 F-box domain-containing protein [Orpheovirus IHUMI-LCC2]
MELLPLEITLEVVKCMTYKEIRSLFFTNKYFMSMFDNDIFRKSIIRHFISDDAKFYSMYKVSDILTLLKYYDMCPLKYYKYASGCLGRMVKKNMHLYTHVYTDEYKKFILSKIAYSEKCNWNMDIGDIINNYYKLYPSKEGFIYINEIEDRKEIILQMLRLGKSDEEIKDPINNVISCIISLDDEYNLDIIMEIVLYCIQHNRVNLITNKQKIIKSNLIFDNFFSSFFNMKSNEDISNIIDNNIKNILKDGYVYISDYIVNGGKVTDVLKSKLLSNESEVIKLFVHCTYPDKLYHIVKNIIRKSMVHDKLFLKFIESLFGDGDINNLDIVLETYNSIGEIILKSGNENFIRHIVNKYDMISISNYIPEHRFIQILDILESCGKMDTLAINSKLANSSFMIYKHLRKS